MNYAFLKNMEGPQKSFGFECTHFLQFFLGEKQYFNAYLVTIIKTLVAWLDLDEQYNVFKYSSIVELAYTSRAKVTL